MTDTEIGELVATVISNNPWTMKPTLVVLAQAVDRWVKAQDAWNSVKWGTGDEPDSVSAKLQSEREYVAAELQDASDALRKMVRR